MHLVDIGFLRTGLDFRCSVDLDQMGRPEALDKDDCQHLGWVDSVEMHAAAVYLLIAELQELVASEQPYPEAIHPNLTLLKKL